MARAPSPSVRIKPGRPALLTDSEVLTLAILASVAPLPQREGLLALSASSHLRPYFPMLCSQGQLNRRIRALQPELRELQRAFAQELACPSAVYRVMDTTLVPAIVRVRASRKGLFCGQASFGRSASKTEWVYGFKVAIVEDPEGVITAFGLAGAAYGQKRLIGDALIASEPPRGEPYAIDGRRTGLHGRSSGTRELWMEIYGCAGCGHPQDTTSRRRRRCEEADRR